ncbi:MAG: DUF177 domain-containing protein [Burkholderiaceae bacterium]|nr:DUF177 domain-containing protein [Burkholderiaceae bacterium]
MTFPTIDTHEFTRRGDTAAGEVSLAGLERLGSMLTSVDGALAWRLAGRSELGVDGSRSPLLHLGLRAAVAMRCVRCLEPVGVPLEVERDYRLVASEAQAEHEDADEDEVDLLVSSRRFDLASLVEDEAIMALPPAPRHDGCAAPRVEDAPEGEGALPARGEGSDAAPRRRNPFAALAALKGGPVRTTPSDAAARGREVAPGEPGEPGEPAADPLGPPSPRPRRR